MATFFERYYPNGLAGKDILDVACNSGGYCFVAGELGARRARGIDIRQHWIDQANFVHSVRYPHLDNVVVFELGDAKQTKDFGEADIVLFKGIFYHLPDPIHTLLYACAAAREVILVNTATDSTVPEHCLSLQRESRTHLMSGVDGIAHFPGGPAALRPVLEYAGFPYIDVVFWRHDLAAGNLGRMELVAHRSEATRAANAAVPIGLVGRFRPPDSLGGWARLDGHPAPLVIRVYEGDELLGEAIADRPHLALSDNCGFDVKLSRPIALADLVTRRIVAWAVDRTGKSLPLPIWEKLAHPDQQGATGGE
jgi:SAM-dependent methyltransferase